MSIGETNQTRHAGDDLKPCPFCGEKCVTTEFDHGQGDKWGYASCDVCAGCGPEVRTNYDREPDGPWHSEAIAAWNTRADAATIKAAVDLMADEHGWVRREKLDKAAAYLQKISRHSNRSCSAIAARALADLEEKE